VAIVATVGLTLVIPYRLTDGDSCLYAAMAHDMAVGRTSWTAPIWDFHGQSFGLTGRGVCFHEHPPGAFWLAAIVERLGARVENAALAANALWTFAAVGGVIAIARRFTSRVTADFAGLVFLLHVGVMHYVQRAALELPLAATASWAVAAGLRLDRKWWWTLVAAIGVAGAVMTRGVLGLVPAGLLVVMLFDKKLRPPWPRLLVALVLATAALWAFDRAHASHFGGFDRAEEHGFWKAYLDRQVVPSLEENGTAHSSSGPAWLYYFPWFLVYSLPWSLLVVWRLVRGPRPIASPEAWRLAAVWIVTVLVGLSLGSREASRYFFQTFIATSLLTALALPREFTGNSAWAVSTLLLLTLPSQIVLKCGFHSRDEWWKTADIAAEHRFLPYDGNYRHDSPPRIRGPFQPEDDRMKSLLRFHLDAWMSSGAITDMKGLQWIPKAGDDFPFGKVVFATPLGAVVDFGK
jgi:4-amino-4-deoxy-L-arabinose transferase-like glycosyltransferase